MTDAIVPVTVEGVVLRAPSSALAPGKSLTDPATVFLSRFSSAQSRRVMTSSLCVLGSLLLGTRVTDPRTVSWAQLRYPHAQRLRALLSEGAYAPATVNRHLSALRGVIEECWQLGLMSQEDHARVQSVKAVRGNKRMTGRALSTEELQRLLAVCDRATTLGLRDAAVVTLAAYGGLRRSEVCGLDVEHWHADGGYVEVLGKGNKWRQVFLPKVGREVIESWLGKRGSKPGPLVMPAAKHGDAVVDRRMTDNGIYSLLAKLGEKAKLEAFTPHDLRRTFITRLLDKGADALTVSKLAGHNNVQTTLGYDKRDERARKAAVALLDND